MKYVVGFLGGIATAWAALAIWQRLPGVPDDDLIANDHGAKVKEALRRLYFEEEW